MLISIPLPTWFIVFSIVMIVGVGTLMIASEYITNDRKRKISEQRSSKDRS